MRLIYRGASYDYNQPALEVREGDILRRNQDAQQRCRTLQEASYPLIYRGSRYTTRDVATALALTPVLRSPQLMVYRGANYIKNANGSTGMVTATKATSAPRTTAPIFKELGRIHTENLRRNLEHRLRVAKQRGDQSLVSLLEAESRELAL